MNRLAYNYNLVERVIMHELSIAQSIVDIIRQYVPKDQEEDVRLVKIRVGPLAGVVPDSLDFCFGAIVTDTQLSKTRLNIEETRLQSRCLDCNEVFDVAGASFICPRCAGGEIKVVSGTELQVVEIELSDRQAGTI
jgi:hydrogenase nickel incorporation protein HypA/HybF